MNTWYTRPPRHLRRAIIVVSAFAFCVSGLTAASTTQAC